MKKIINAVVRIEYEIDESEELTPAQEEDIAINLAIRPNFHTIENGVQLNKVHLEHATPYVELDWWALEHTPDKIFIENK